MSNSPIDLPEDIDSAVQIAIQQLRDFLRKTGSVRAEDEFFQPRVSVGEGNHYVSRRPFKKKGNRAESVWVVRYCGTATLTKPHLANGHIAFRPDWSA